MASGLCARLCGRASVLCEFFLPGIGNRVVGDLVQAAMFGLMSLDEIIEQEALTKPDLDRLACARPQPVDDEIVVV